MTKTKQYKCVNCGEPSPALYKTYGPSVLKLNKCVKCNGIVDKYIEYDPVIVMIDLVLISKEAQRHVLYNTDFKSYWKLFIILILLETYGVWKNDSLFNIIVNLLCGIQTNSIVDSTLVLPQNFTLASSWSSQCESWVPGQKTDDNDLFIWEKDFYIQFISVLTGIVVFILTVHCLMRLISAYLSSHNIVAAAWRTLAQGWCACAAGVCCALPMLVWGPDAAPRTRALHYALAAAYGFVVCVSVFTVVYECPVAVTVFVLVFSNFFKFLTMFHITPLLRTFVT